MFRRSSTSVIGGHADRNLAVAAVAYAPIPTLIPPHLGNPARIAGDFHPVGFIPGVRLRQPADNGNAFMNSRINCRILHLNALYIIRQTQKRCVRHRAPVCNGAHRLTAVRAQMPEISNGFPRSAVDLVVQLHALKAAQPRPIHNGDVILTASHIVPVQNRHIRLLHPHHFLPHIRDNGFRPVISSNTADFPCLHQGVLIQIHRISIPVLKLPGSPDPILDHILGIIVRRSFVAPQNPPEGDGLRTLSALKNQLAVDIGSRCHKLHGA